MIDFVQETMKDSLALLSITMMDYYSSVPSMLLIASAIFWAVAFAWWWDLPLRFQIFVQRQLLGRKKNVPPLPPGSLGVPFVGDLPFLLARFILSPSAAKDDFLGEHRLRKTRKLGEIFCDSLPPLASRSVVLTSHEGVKWATSLENRGVEGTWPDSVNALLGEHSVSVKKGAAHKRLRNGFLPVFQPKSLRLYVEQMNKIVQKHLRQEWTQEKKEADGDNDDTGPTTKRIVAAEQMRKLTFKVIADLVLGLDLEADRELVDELNKLFKTWFGGLFMTTLPYPGNPFIKALEAHKKILVILMDVVRKRRRLFEEGTRKRDLLDVLLASPHRDEKGQDTRLTDKEIVDNLVTLLFAGSDTSSCNMTNILLLLSEHPDVLQRLRQEHVDLVEKRRATAAAAGEEPSSDDLSELTWDEMETLRFTNQVILEALRVYQPVGGSFRKATRDLVYKGYRIPKGYTIVLDFKSMNVDATYHKDFELYNPDRFGFTAKSHQSKGSSNNSSTVGPGPLGGLSHRGFQPFGSGARMCIGYRLAMAEMNVFLHHMVLNYDFQQCPSCKRERNYFPLPMPMDGGPMLVTSRN